MSNGFGGHPLQQERPDLRAETLDTRLSDRNFYGQLLDAEQRLSLGQANSQASNWKEAAGALAQSITTNR